MRPSPGRRKADGAYDLAMTGEHEEVLAGGNMTAVVRVGDTVRRGAGPWTPTIHAFERRQSK